MLPPNEVLDRSALYLRGTLFRVVLTWLTWHVLCHRDDLSGACDVRTLPHGLFFVRTVRLTVVCWFVAL